MLDFGSFKLPNGTPDHPHRGFETVSYMKKGTIYHEDFLGNKGVLEAGDCQWMTTGRGIVHSEMPGSWEEESRGFQLWINLAAKDKFCEPGYQEIKRDLIPTAKKDGVTAKVIAGESLETKGPIFARTPAFYLDVEMDKNTKFEQIIPKGWNAFSYVYEGEAHFSNTKVKVAQNRCVVLKKDDNDILVIETQNENAKFLLLAGKPLNEPIVSYGPFVLNTQEELLQAFEDYQHGKNGFENALAWKSQNRLMAKKN